MHKKMKQSAWIIFGLIALSKFINAPYSILVIAITSIFTAGYWSYLSMTEKPQKLFLRWLVPIFMTVAAIALSLYSIMYFIRGDWHGDLAERYRLGQACKSAYENYEIALSKSSRHHLFYKNNYAWLLITCSQKEFRDSRKALELLGSVQLNIANREADTLACIYSTLGDFERGLAIAEKWQLEERVKSFQKRLPCKETL